MSTQSNRLKSWEERIADAKERGRFTDYEKRMALSWNSCAVGEMTPSNRKILEPSMFSFFDGVPRKARQELDTLGGNFYFHVSEQLVEDAEKTYKQIQAWFAKYKPLEEVQVSPVVSLPKEKVKQLV